MIQRRLSLLWDCLYAIEKQITFRHGNWSVKRFFVLFAECRHVHYTSKKFHPSNFTRMRSVALVNLECGLGHRQQYNVLKRLKYWKCNGNNRNKMFNKLQLLSSVQFENIHNNILKLCWGRLTSFSILYSFDISIILYLELLNTFIIRWEPSITTTFCYTIPQLCSLKKIFGAFALISTFKYRKCRSSRWSRT